jgi:hypothetical protein
MIRNWLSSAATFSPPDELGSGGEVETPIAGDTGGTVETPVGGSTETPETSEPPRTESVSESIRRAVKETKDKAAAPEGAPKTPKSPQTDGAKPGDKTAKTDSDPTKAGNTETAPQAKSGAPSSWKAEEKAIWDSLPDVARSAITRREADSARGLQEVRNRYTEIDSAIAPYSAVMTQNRVTPGQAINQLFKWHMELAGPNKVEAFKTLAKNFGVDPATLAAAQSTGAQPGADSQNTIPENLRPVISGLETRLKSFEDQNAVAMQTAAKQTWENWSKDKTHAPAVRGLMAQLINGDLALIQAGQPQVSNTINPQTMAINMDAAYQAAVYAHPEVRALVLQEEQKKRDAAATAAAANARKAGTSLRSGAPAGSVNANSAPPKVETVGESIRRAYAEVRGTQH